MRGGAIILYTWGTIVLVLMAINGVWTTDWINQAMFGFAVVVIYTTATALWVRDREAIRRGPPEARVSIEAVPRSSFAALITGLGIGIILFGAVFGDVFLFVGGALLIAGVGRWVAELMAQRRSMERLRSGELANRVPAASLSEATIPAQGAPVVPAPPAQSPTASAPATATTTSQRRATR